MPWFAGLPRDNVIWHPTIDLDRCVKCGMCMNCGKNVYDWAKNGPVVARPNACVVGCSTCANLCQGEAIKFPEVQSLRDLYKKHDIWAKAKRQLREEGKLI